MKWILPPGWLIGWGYFTFLMFTRPEDIAWEGGLQMPAAAKWGFLAVGAFGLWWMARYLLPLQRVELRGEALAVSRWRRERLIPLADIHSVRWRFRPNWEHAGLVAIESRAAGSPSGLVLFVPRSEAVIEELRTLVAKTTGSRLAE